MKRRIMLIKSPDTFDELILYLEFYLGIMQC